MNNFFARFTLALAILATFCLPIHAQTALTTTTLSAAVGVAPDAGGTCFNVASATGIVAPGFTVPNNPNGNQTILFTDREAMFVTSLNGTYVCVSRGWGQTKAAAHASGATVYVVSGDQVGLNDKAGACTATALPFLPYINVQDGNIYSCGTSGQWAQVLSGTQTGSPSSTISFVCTGTVGSAETEFVNSTLACSGSTTELVTWTATTAGTVANLRVSSSANFLGTGGAVFSVNKNGSVVTGFTCAPTAATKACANMLPGFTDVGTVGAVDSVAVVPGDRISVKYLSSTSDTGANLSVQLSVF